MLLAFQGHRSDLQTASMPLDIQLFVLLARRYLGHGDHLLRCVCLMCLCNRFASLKNAEPCLVRTRVHRRERVPDPWIHLVHPWRQRKQMVSRGCTNVHRVILATQVWTLCEATFRPEHDTREFTGLLPEIMNTGKGQIIGGFPGQTQPLGSVGMMTRDYGQGLLELPGSAC